MKKYSVFIKKTINGSPSLIPVKLMQKKNSNLRSIDMYEKEIITYEAEFYGIGGDGEYVYVQINNDSTWYYAKVVEYGAYHGFSVSETNIPNAYQKTNWSIGIPKVLKIRIGTQGNPSTYTGPKYQSSSSTGDFVGLGFTSSGGTAPSFKTSEITMTQDSRIYFEGDY